MPFLHLFLLDVPAALRRDARLLWLAALVFVVSILFAFIYVQFDTQAVNFIYDAEQLVEFRRMYHPEWQAMLAQDQSPLEMFLFYVRNNGWTGVQLFLLGAVFGVGTLALLAYNGFCLGLLMGYLVASGYSSTLWPSIIAHSSFEVMATLIAAAAGMKWGFSLVLLASPQRRAQFATRLAQSVMLLLYAFILFVLAALTEAWWSANYSISVPVKYFSGVVFWVLLPGFIMFYGRSTARQ